MHSPDTTRDGSPAAESDAPVVLITGAGSGIGAATALAFAGRGWTVYATDVETPLPGEVTARCRTRELDVTDEEGCRAAVEDILAETGRIDLLVNNAGYAVPGAVEDVPVDDARRQFDVLVHGVQRLVRQVLPGMRARGSGRIVTVSSVLGQSSYPGLGTYCAGKAAVESLTDALRMELRDVPGVEVSLVEPAWVDTGFAAHATERLAERERTVAYARTYDALERGWVLDGGPLSASPESVADAVVEAATAPSPDPRYPVGAFATFVRWTHWLPASVQDPLRRAFGRASVTAHGLYDVFGRETEPAAEGSTLTLSTGQSVSLPLSTDATIVGATVSADLSAVHELLPAGLAPLRVTPTRAAVTFLCVEYRRIGDGGIDPYGEFGILVPATPGEGTQPLSAPLTSEVGAYVWTLPVTTEPARALGVEGWNYPKSVAEIEFEDDGRRRRTHVSVDGEPVCSVAIQRPRTVPGSVLTRSYTVADGTILREPLELTGELGAAPLSDRIEVTLGTHEWADDLRALDLGSRALLRVGFDGEFVIHPGEPVDGG